MDRLGRFLAYYANEILIFFKKVGSFDPYASRICWLIVCTYKNFMWMEHVLNSNFFVCPIRLLLLAFTAISGRLLKYLMYKIWSLAMGAAFTGGDKNLILVV